MNKRVKFKSKIFRLILIAFLSIMILYNLYAYFTGITSAIFPIIFQLAMLALVVIRYYYLKIILQVWSGIFLITLSLIQVISKLIKAFISNINIDTISIIRNLLFIVFGILIFYLSSTLVLQNEDNH